jgi:hypothetical protein
MLRGLRPFVGSSSLATSLVTLLFKAFVPSLPELGGGK